MCGIFGIISDKLPDHEFRRRLMRMGRLQQHRGPDGQKERIWSSGRSRIGLGLVRLAILDLVTGMQPICSTADNSAIVCNGQIYNYIELRPQVADMAFVSRGDIEVALHLYRKKGIDFLNELNGMYAGAIYDPVEHQLVLFRDRFGIKPLYYARTDEGFAFSSEIKPLFEAVGLERSLNKKRLPTYFTYRYVPGDDTLFEGVARVPPGSYLLYDLKTHEIRIQRYWNYTFGRVNEQITLNEAAWQFHSLFQDAIRLRLRSDVEVGSFISGGIDSSAVSATAAFLQPLLRLYTIAFEEEKYNELPHVRSLLKEQPRHFSRTRLKTAVCSRQMLRELPGIIRAVEEPISLGTMLPTDQVCELASRDVKVVLTGEGADEIFAGYRKFMIEAVAAHYHELQPNQQAALSAKFPELDAYLSIRESDPARRYIQTEALFSPEELDRLIGKRPVSTLFSDNARPTLTGNEHPVNAAIAFESRFRLPDYVVLRLDKLAMRHSLETRTPLLDYRLAEFASGLPVRLKTNISMVREKFICSYAYVKYGTLNARAAFRRKQPFTFPMADWLADYRSLPEYLQEILRGETVHRQNILDPAYVRSLAQEVSSEGVGPQTLVSAADRLFSVIVFTIWYQEFMT